MTSPNPLRSPAPLVWTFALLATLTLGACGGGSSENSDSGGASPDLDDPSSVLDDPSSGGDVPGTDPDPEEPTPIAGDIALYGVVAVGDEDGVASGDALASFSRLSTSVGAAAFGSALSLSNGVCTVEQDDGRADLMSLGRLYLPVPDAVSLEAIDAGESVLLSSTGGGGWIELQGRPSDTFYTRPLDQAEPSGTVPDDLVANITGAAFPAFVDVPLPAVTPLVDIAYDGGGNITRDTRFTWQASGTSNTRVRIESASDGGFFIGESTNVSCLVPDTGAFAFPPVTRAALGADFDGAEPDFSRIAIDSVQQDDALLVLVRESFTP